MGRFRIIDGGHHGTTSELKGRLRAQLKLTTTTTTTFLLLQGTVVVQEHTLQGQCHQTPLARIIDRNLSEISDQKSSLKSDQRYDERDIWPRPPRGDFLALLHRRCGGKRADSGGPPQNSGGRKEREGKGKNKNFLEDIRTPRKSKSPEGFQHSRSSQGGNLVFQDAHPTSTPCRKNYKGMGLI